MQNATYATVVFPSSPAYNRVLDFPGKLKELLENPGILKAGAGIQRLRVP